MAAKNKKPFVVGICGGSASGKSWLSDFLKEGLGDRAVVVCQDWYYKNNSHLSPQEAEKLNFDHPNAIETSLFLRQLRKLINCNSIEAPSYDYATHTRKKETHRVVPADVIIVEGLFVLHDKRVRSLFDLSVYIDVPSDERLLRRIRRDVEHRRVDLEETLRLYEHFVRPMHTRYIEPSSKVSNGIWRQLSDPQFPKKFLAQVRRGSSIRGRRGSKR